MAAALGHGPVQSAPEPPAPRGHTGVRAVGLSPWDLAGWRSLCQGSPSGRLDPRKGRPLAAGCSGGRRPGRPGRVDSGSSRRVRADAASPGARARAAAGTEDGFMGAPTGISHFNGCVFIFMVTSYLWQWLWLCLYSEAGVAFSQRSVSRCSGTVTQTPCSGQVFTEHLLRAGAAGAQPRGGGRGGGWAARLGLRRAGGGAGGVVTAGLVPRRLWSFQAPPAPGAAPSVTPCSARPQSPSLV